VPEPAKRVSPACDRSPGNARNSQEIHALRRDRGVTPPRGRSHRGARTTPSSSQTGSGWTFSVGHQPAEGDTPASRQSETHLSTVRSGSLLRVDTSSEALPGGVGAPIRPGVSRKAGSVQAERRRGEATHNLAMSLRTIFGWRGDHKITGPASIMSRGIVQCPWRSFRVGHGVDPKALQSQLIWRDVHELLDRVTSLSKASRRHSCLRGL
jgi:hypothetical protein